MAEPNKNEGLNKNKIEIILLFLLLSYYPTVGKPKASAG